MNIDNIQLNELIEKIRAKKNKNNERQRNNYLKRKTEGRNKQVKKPEEYLKRGPKNGRTKDINIDNNLLLLSSILNTSNKEKQNETNLITNEM
jgi:hypothetical protein